MAKQLTVIELHRALLHLTGAVNQLREIAGDFPAIDKELRAARGILEPEIVAFQASPGELVRVTPSASDNDGDPKPGAR